MNLESLADLPDLVIYLSAAGAIIVWTFLVIGASLLIARLRPLRAEVPGPVKGELDLYTDEELQRAA